MNSLSACDENKILGTIGAILGGLLGYLLWIFCGYYFLIPGIVGFALAFFIIKAYIMLAGSISRTGLVICSIVSLLWISISEIGCVTLHIYFDWQIREPAEILKNINNYVNANGLFMKMISNTLVGILTFAAGCFNMYYKIWKETGNGPKEKVTVDNEDPF